jgi:serine/threonine-protein kinase
VKVLRSRYSSDPKNVELFRREGELGSKLKHPNIVPIHEVYSRGSIHFLVMDFIEGRNLREFYKTHRRFGPLEAAKIAADMMAGLNYAAQQGVTHRDLKMSNVLVSSSGTAMLVDFGLAGLGADEGDAGERTIDYAGLERATSVRREDPRSDIFFAGCIFYQLLCGHPPMSETRDRMARLSKNRYLEIKPILEINPKLPLPLTLIVNKAIEFDPDKRYQNPGDMLMDLKLAIMRMEKPAEAAQASQELSSREGIGADGQPRKLMVVESDGRMQDLFRNLFKSNGYRVLVAADPHRALSRFFDDRSAADMLLFSTAAIGEAALDVFNRFGREQATRDLPAVLLLGQQHHAWEDQADTAEHRTVLKMPIKPRHLRQALVDVAKCKMRVPT